MRSMLRFLAPCSCLLVLAGCPDTNVIGGDTGPAIDAFGERGDAPRDDAPAERADAFRDDAPVIADDAFVPPDAFAPDPCTTPGAMEDVTCGRCGTQGRFCTSALVWEYGPCSEPADAVCDPGTTGMVACGTHCGTAPARCDTMCHWVESGACVDSGECEPGDTERTTDGCMGGATRGRTCGASCVWGMYAACVDLPDDFDGDGVPYTTDCDDADPSIVIGSTDACGSFACAGTPVRTMVPGTRTCMGPGWSVCARAATCTEVAPASCVGMTGYFETRSCATAGCDDGLTENRSCRGGAWSAWSGCAAGRARPASCDPTITTCGVCSEGVAFAYCDAACDPTTSDCTGEGCVPGTRRRSTMGCAMGEYREITCDAACVAGAPGPCMAYRPEVDVLLLVDNTGSHTGLVTENAARLATELVGGLLADADVRVGVASFADFPHGSYGSAPDEPFRGILAPTSDMAMITTALSGIAARGGGDLPESGIEALHVAAGGTPHPDSFPFTCPAGLAAGGCWRASSQRAVVMITDITQHNIPSPVYMGGMPITPYTGITPSPPLWATARGQMIAGGVAFFAIVPEPTMGWGAAGENDAPAQMRFIATELAQDPDASIVVYPAGTRDLTASARAMVANLRAYLGLSP